MAHPLMRLITLHGRRSPDEQMDDWGFDGPSFDGIRAIHVTYSSQYNLHFETTEFAQKCVDVTGWEWFDEDAVQMQFHDDLLYMPNSSEYFGDWELQTVEGNGRAIPQEADRLLAEIVAELESRSDIHPDNYNWFNYLIVSSADRSVRWPELAQFTAKARAYLKGVAP